MVACQACDVSCAGVYGLPCGLGHHLRVFLDKDFSGAHSNFHEANKKTLEKHSMGGGFWLFHHHRALLGDGSGADTLSSFWRSICSELASGGAANDRGL